MKHEIKLTNIALLLPILAIFLSCDNANHYSLSSQDRTSVLLIDGMNNHDWPRTTKYIVQILEGSGLFEIDVSTSPPGNAPDEEWDRWKPDFKRYDVVVSNFNGGHKPDSKHWPPELENDLEDYVRGGGGLVIFHAANNSFINWDAYNEMIGLGWRNKNFGESINIARDGSVLRIPKGQGLNPGHGKSHDFQITILDKTHPINQGIPETWMHPLEQLSHGQHGPAKNIHILSYAYSKDSKQNEPIDWIVSYGKGRVYTTMLGHLWKNGTDLNFKCVGFQTMLIRAVQWTAVEVVTYPVPSDFPTAETIRTNDAVGP